MQYILTFKELLESQRFDNNVNLINIKLEVVNKYGDLVDPMKYAGYKIPNEKIDEIFIDWISEKIFGKKDIIGKLINVGKQGQIYELNDNKVIKIFVNELNSFGSLYNVNSYNIAKFFEGKNKTGICKIFQTGEIDLSKENIQTSFNSNKIYYIVMENLDVLKFKDIIYKLNNFTSRILDFEDGYLYFIKKWLKI